MGSTSHRKSALTLVLFPQDIACEDIQGFITFIAPLVIHFSESNIKLASSIYHNHTIKEYMEGRHETSTFLNELFFVRHFKEFNLSFANYDHLIMVLKHWGVIWKVGFDVLFHLKLIEIDLSALCYLGKLIRISDSMSFKTFYLLYDNFLCTICSLWQCPYNFYRMRSLPFLIESNISKSLFVKGYNRHWSISNRSNWISFISNKLDLPNRLWHSKILIK